MTSVEATTLRLLEQIAITAADKRDPGQGQLAVLEPAAMLRALTESGFDLTAAIVALHNDH